MLIKSIATSETFFQYLGVNSSRAFVVSSMSSFRPSARKGCSTKTSKMSLRKQITKLMNRKPAKHLFATPGIQSNDNRGQCITNSITDYANTPLQSHIMSDFLTRAKNSALNRRVCHAQSVEESDCHKLRKACQCSTHLIEHFWTRAVKKMSEHTSTSA